MLSLFLAASALASLPNPTGTERWTIGEPGGSFSVAAVDRSSDTAYAHAYYGLGRDLYRTVDSGRSWLPLGPQPDSAIGYGLAVSFAESRHLLAANTSGIARSIDGGGAWKQELQLTDVDLIQYDPSRPAVAYAVSHSTSAVTYYRSDDDGVSWIPLTPPLIPGEFIRLTFAVSRGGTLLIPVDNPTGGRLLRSSDTGKTWSSVALPAPESRLESRLIVDPVSPHILYDLTRLGLFRSEDDGASWARRGSGIPLTLAIDPAEPSTLYAGGETAPDTIQPKDAGLWKSTDSGISWHLLTTPFPPLTAILSVDVSASGSVLWVSTVDGIFKSTDSGATWTTAFDGLPGPAITALFADPFRASRVYAGVLTAAARLYRSDDGGQRWLPLTLKVGEAGSRALQVFSAFAVDPEGKALYAVAQSCSSIPNAYLCFGGVSKSNDGGASWMDLPLLVALNSIVLDPANPRILYASAVYDSPSGALGQGFKSSDAGASWAQLTGFPTSPLRAWLITSNDVLAATCDGGVFASNDGGITWNARNSGLTNTCASALARSPGPSGLLYVSTGDGIFMSADQGSTWKSTGFLQAAASVVADPIQPSILYAGTNEGVFRSLDGGTTWASLNDGLRDLTIRTLAIDAAGLALHAMTSTDLYHLRLRTAHPVAPR